MKYTVSIQFYDDSARDAPEFYWFIKPGDHNPANSIVASGYSSSIEKARDAADKWLDRQAFNWEMHKLDEKYVVDI